MLLLATLLAPVAPAFAQGQLSPRASREEGATAAPVRLDLPLVEERLRVTIDHVYALSVLDQVYENRSGVVLEGVYSHRGPAGTQVRGYAYWNGETRIVGEVFEKQTARQIYEEVTGRGRDPGLLEQTGEGAFTFRVFPIAPTERKRVQLTLGARLHQRGSRFEYRMPLASPDARIEVAIHDTRGLRDIESPTHTLSVNSLPTGVAVQARRKVGAAELVLRYRIAGTADVLALRHQDTATGTGKAPEGYVALAITAPQNPTRKVPMDVTLVLDRSGSMSGEPIAQARLAAAAVLQRLRDEDRVNVIAFNDGVDALFPEPQALRADVRRRASEYIAHIQDGGGTNLAAALAHALAAKRQAGRPQLVLFLTDGQSDPADVFRVLDGDKGETRVFTVGLGSGVNKPLLARVARLRAGRFTFIESASALVDRVTQVWAGLEQPVLLDLEVKAQGAVWTRQYPDTLSDLGSEETLVVTGRLRGDQATTFTVKGRWNNQAFTRTVTVPAAGAATKDHAFTGALWAQERIAFLEEEIALRGETDELKSEVIEYALAYDVVTAYTSFLAIPESELDDSTRAQLVDARTRKNQILAKHEDAAALSRTDMPPGDPVLTVYAPASAQMVTALFPFGLIKELAYDPRKRVWSTRFLVPKTVADGTYETRVQIVDADGRIRFVMASYRIDSAEPDFDLEVVADPQGAFVRVYTQEAMREVRAARVADPRQRVELVLTGQRADGVFVYEGFLPLAERAHELRVVVTDKARNESVETTTVVVPGPEGC